MHGTPFRYTRISAFCGMAVLAAACSVHPVTFTPPDSGAASGSGATSDAGVPGAPDDSAGPGSGSGDMDAGDPPPPPPTTATITVQLGGAATGSVSAQGADLVCTDVCTATVPIGTMVTLVASPDVGATFSSWTGDCSGSDPSCTFTVAQDVTAAAGFDVAMFTLTVGVTGDGTGSVTSTTGGVACPGACTMTVPYNTMINLSASQDASVTFLGWSGGCIGSAPACTLTITADTSVSAAFTKDNQLVVSKAGNGSGIVTSNPMGISCGATCAETVPPGAVVKLSAAPAADSTFTGWSGGGCTGTGTCTVTVSTAVQVTATFTLMQFTLQVTNTATGGGGGKVTSSPTGISCGATCSHTYNAGTIVTLTASPTPGSTFSGWTGGGCSGTGTCKVTINAATSVTAKFAIGSYVLSVQLIAKDGNGSGNVTSSPAGINCGGGTCTHVYAGTTMVTLSQAADAGSTFLGWGGACSGFAVCTVTMDSANTVTARFEIVECQPGMICK